MQHLGVNFGVIGGLNFFLYRVRCLPEVATRMYDPASSRFLPQLFLGERATVAEQLGGESVVGRLKERADLLLEEAAAAVAAGRLRQRLVVVDPPLDRRRIARRRPQL